MALRSSPQVDRLRSGFNEDLHICAKNNKCSFVWWLSGSSVSSSSSSSCVKHNWDLLSSSGVHWWFQSQKSPLKCAILQKSSEDTNIFKPIPCVHLPVTSTYGVFKDQSQERRGTQKWPTPEGRTGPTCFGTPTSWTQVVGSVTSWICWLQNPQQSLLGRWDL